MEIQWYPGHMAKAKRLLQSQLSKVDLVIELCDARLPLSSRNPALNELVRHKRRILLLCKADLAENGKTQEWLAYFKSRGVEAMAYDATPGKTKQAKAFIASAAQAVVERGERRGMNKTVRAMVIGVPNVGKSTFINRLYGGSVTETGDRPGVTKSNRWVKVTPYLEVLDTPGMLWPKLNDQRGCYPAGLHRHYSGRCIQSGRTVCQPVGGPDDLASCGNHAALQDQKPGRERLRASGRSLPGTRILDARRRFGYG